MPKITDDKSGNYLITLSIKGLRNKVDISNILSKLYYRTKESLLFFDGSNALDNFLKMHLLDKLSNRRALMGFFSLPLVSV